MLDKQEEISRDTMNTNVPFITIVIPPNSHILMNLYIPSEPLMTPCKYYITKRKALTSTQQCFYFHVESVSNNHLKYSHTIFPNRIFDTIHDLPLPSLLPTTFLSSSISHHFNT
jgi:hypothetical protein